MRKDDIRLLFEYDRWANNRILRAVSALTPEQFTRNLGGAFGSVRDTLVHLIGGEWGWLEYWKAPLHTPELLNELWTRNDALFNPDFFPDIGTVMSKWKEVEREQAGFLSRLQDESLEKLLPIHTTRVTLALLMQHLVNHSTYHRGQVAMMVRQLGAEPLATDFHVFLLELSGGAAVAQ